MVDHQEMGASSVQSPAKMSPQGEIVRQPDPSRVEIKAAMKAALQIDPQQPASTSTPPVVVRDEKQETAQQPAQEEVAAITLQLPDLVFSLEKQEDTEQSPKSDSSSQDDTLIEKSIEETVSHEVIEPTKTNETTVAGSVHTQELHQNSRSRISLNMMSKRHQSKDQPPRKRTGSQFQRKNHRIPRHCFRQQMVSTRKTSHSTSLYPMHSLEA